MKKAGLLLVAVAAAAVAAPGVVAAQQAPVFIPEFNTEGYPPLPADRRVSISATGHLQGFRGRAWWQAFAFCRGVWENQARDRERDGDPRGALDLRDTADDLFLTPAVARLMADRGISADAANEILQPDITFQFFVAAEEGRPFGEDAARCQAIGDSYASIGQ